MQLVHPDIDVGRMTGEEGVTATRAISRMSDFPEALSLVLSCILAGLVLISAFMLLKPFLLLRADLLMWEEGDFVGNMIKFDLGIPLYTDPADSNSMIYGPGAFLLTYVIAWIGGLTKSVAGLRLIQSGYVIAASLLATISAAKITCISFHELKPRHINIWGLFTFLGLLTIATAPFSNKFVLSLHVDALSLLVSIFSFWTMVRYLSNPSAQALLLMSIFPAIGFVTKQFLISWALVMIVFLLILDGKNRKRLIVFASLAFALIGIAYAGCYMMWGENYRFWTFNIMGGVRSQVLLAPDAYGISLIRIADHFIRMSPEIMIGVAGSWLHLWFGNTKRMLPLILAWMVLIGSEAFSSGAGWETFYHFGPGVLIGAVLLFSALPGIWYRGIPVSDKGTGIKRWAYAAFMFGVTFSVFSIVKAIPTGDKTAPRYVRLNSDVAELDGYISDIEAEFGDLDGHDVLLDVGSWVYLDRGILQKDRAVSLADQAPAGIYQNFEITNERIRNRVYKKILLHDFDSPYFLYEWSDWHRKSGFKENLLANYVALKTIPAPHGSFILARPEMRVGPVTVFVPKDSLNVIN
jgi:hypothetical protein